MIDILIDIFSSTEQRASKIFLTAFVIAIFEYLMPQSHHSVVSRIRGAIFWAVYIPITVTGLILFRRLWGQLGISPLFHIDVSFLSSSSYGFLSVLGGILASLFALQVGEFFYYWFHRAQHTFPLLWRFHAEHHSLKEMNAFNSNHHFSEELFRVPFITIPISVLFSFEQGYVPWLWAFLIGCQGIYEHSATKIHFGFFRYVVPDNLFHRIHHSTEKKHFNRNFGSGSALWDILFSTAYYPRNDEWPDTGLNYMSEPKNIGEFLFRPFKKMTKETELGSN